MAKSRLSKEIAPIFSTEISVNQIQQAAALGVTRKFIRVLRTAGVIDYPMTAEQYSVLAPLFRGVGSTDITKALLNSIKRQRRELLIKTAGMGLMESYSYGYFVRFRLENLHKIRAKCSYRQWRDDMMSKFPKGTVHLKREFYDRSRIKAKNTIQYAIRTSTVKALAYSFGLVYRDYDGVFINERRDNQKAALKARNAAEARIRKGEQNVTDIWDDLRDEQAMAAARTCKTDKRLTL